MSETWVFNTKDSDRCIDFAALGLSEGWLVSVYRVPEEEKRALRVDKRLSNEMMHEIFDQDA
jgi:hypothetical protein